MDQTQEEIISQKARELADKEISEIRKQAEEYKSKVDDVANARAIAIAKEMFEEKNTQSIELSQFNDNKTQLLWLQEQKALPKDETAGQTLMKMRVGKQMGMTEFEAINGIGFVNGRMCMWGEVMVGMITKAGYKIKFVTSDEKICKVELSKDGETHEEEFKIEEAEKAGWTAKGFVWKNQPKLMLRYKAIRQAAKFFCPHVLGGMITAEEAQTELDPIPNQSGQPVLDTSEIVNEIKSCNTIEDLEKIKEKISGIKNNASLIKEYSQRKVEIQNAEKENGQTTIDTLEPTK